MKFQLTAALISGFVVLACGCGTSRDYRAADLSSENAYHKGKSAPQLEQNEVLGLKERGQVSDADIRQILDETRSVRLDQGSTVLLVQSGSRHPDPEMVRQLAQHFTVIPYTGVPSELRSEGGDDVSKALRLAAAHSKAEHILVYWGHMEMKRDDLPTGIVSWVPVIDFVVPDEYQKVRVYLSAALVDVRTGQWATFRTEPLEEKTLTTRYAREKEPNWPLGGVKGRAYEACVRKLVDGYLASRQ